MQISARVVICMVRLPFILMQASQINANVFTCLVYTIVPNGQTCCTYFQTVVTK